MKKIILVSISMIIIFSTSALIAAFANGNNVDGGDSNMITQKETAIKIGSALIAEHFPADFPSVEMNITAEEKDGIWKVYNVNPQTKTDDGRMHIIKGGVIYVEFRKSNGEIIKIGIDD